MAQGLMVSSRALFGESAAFRFLVFLTAAFTALAIIAQFGQGGARKSGAPASSSGKAPQPAFATQQPSAPAAAASGPAFSFGNPSAATSAPPPVPLPASGASLTGAPPPPRASPMLRGVPFDELRK